MSEITNTPLKVLAQATLLVRFGGLGARYWLLQHTCLPPMPLPTRCHPTSTHQSLPVPFYDTAIQVWSQGHDNDSLVGASAEKERNWDNIKAIKVAESLLNEASDDIERARLLAARTRSGAWLHAFPVSSLGLRLYDSSLRVAVNNIIHQSQTAAGTPSRLEPPPGLVRTDGKRPDGMTLVQWKSGHPLVWDVTCPDTNFIYQPSNC